MKLLLSINKKYVITCCYIIFSASQYFATCFLGYKNIGDACNKGSELKEEDMPII